MSRGRNEAGSRQERETCGVHQLGRDGGDPLVGRAGSGRAGNKKETCYGAEYIAVLVGGGIVVQGKGGEVNFSWLEPLDKEACSMAASAQPTDHGNSEQVVWR